MRIPLKASKPHRYAGKALRSGQEYEASQADAKVLTAVGLATYATRKVEPAAKTPAPAAFDDERAALRETYAARAGKKPHAFWGADRLRKELAALETPATPDKPAE